MPVSTAFAFCWYIDCVCTRCFVNLRVSTAGGSGMATRWRGVCGYSCGSGSATPPGRGVDGGCRCANFWPPVRGGLAFGVFTDEQAQKSAETNTIDSRLSLVFMFQVFDRVRSTRFNDLCKWGLVRRQRGRSSAGERCDGIADVGSAILPGSTNLRLPNGGLKSRMGQPGTPGFDGRVVLRLRCS